MLVIWKCYIGKDELEKGYDYMIKPKSKYTIITTINDITEGINEFAKNNERKLLIVSDKKTPQIIPKKSNIKILDVKWQERANYDFIKVCPYNHYSRKNIGYIYAIKCGASEIFDTDDDNIPYQNWHDNFNLSGRSYDVVVSPKYTNVYSIFTDKSIWPRGFPLRKIGSRDKIKFGELKREASIIQGLADEDPDVDAIYRLLFKDKVLFDKRKPVLLDAGVYCPINSQNTLWLKDAFIYLYLPISVSFRFTDILRGYIAQRGIWEINKNIAFVSPTVFQKRNFHDLMKDFADEIECYLNIDKVISILDSVSLTGDPQNDIKAIYQELYKSNIVKEIELTALDAWIKDVTAK